MNLLYKLLAKPYLNQWLKEQNKPTGFNDLEFAFVQEVNGKPMRFYRWPERLDMPTVREGELEKIIKLMMMGLTAKNLDDMVDVAIENKVVAIEHRENKKVFDSAMTKLGAVLIEIQNRKDKIIPVELVYNLLAVSYVREDEDPQSFDKEVQKQKAELFQTHADNNSSFFFQLPELKSKLSWLNLSEANLTDYINASKAQQAFLKEALSFTLRAENYSEQKKAAEI